MRQVLKTIKTDLDRILRGAGERVLAENPAEKCKESRAGEDCHRRDDHAHREGSRQTSRQLSYVAPYTTLAISVAATSPLA